MGAGFRIIASPFETKIRRRENGGYKTVSLESPGRKSLAISESNDLGLFGRAREDFGRVANHPLGFATPSLARDREKDASGLSKASGIIGMDSKVLHIDGTAERKHLSSANAADCLCFPLSRGLLSRRAT